MALLRSSGHFFYLHEAFIWIRDFGNVGRDSQVHNTNARPDTSRTAIVCVSATDRGWFGEVVAGLEVRGDGRLGPGVRGRCCRCEVGAPPARGLEPCPWAR